MIDVYHVKTERVHAKKDDGKGSIDLGGQRVCLAWQAEMLEETLYKLRGWLNEKSACSNCAEAARILDHTIKGLENE
jgi:hypothetical protein